MSKKVRIIEMGLRDGLQNESRFFSVEEKLQLTEKLVAAGHRWIEIGAFVSPKWIPQMQNTEDLVKKLPSAFKRKTEFSVLVPNMQGLEVAIQSGIKEVALFTAASETFNQKNINASIEESFERFAEMKPLLKKHKIKVRGYISCAFVCPYEGIIAPQKVVPIVKRLLALGCYEISVGDTIGAANPKQVESLLKKFKNVIPQKKLAMHFHDTRGMALANILKSLEMGVRVFDASIGGLGGCPYAKGASGNVATEDVVNMLESMGFDTGLDLAELQKTSVWLSGIMDKPMNSKLYKLPQLSVFGRAQK